MERYAILVILGIVFVSTLAVISYDSIVGAYSTSYGYGASKIYGGGIRKSLADNPSAFSRSYGEAITTQRYQNFMYSNRDKWDCSFGNEAKTNTYPCIFDEELQKYCCVLAPLSLV